MGTGAAIRLERDWGRRVAERRQALGLSQQQLADLSEVSQQTVSKIERGEIVPRDRLKLVVAKRLCTTVAELFPWPEDVA